MHNGTFRDFSLSMLYACVVEMLGVIHEGVVEAHSYYCVFIRLTLSVHNSSRLLDLAGVAAKICTHTSGYDR